MLDNKKLIVRTGEKIPEKREDLNIFGSKYRIRICNLGCGNKKAD